MSDFAQRRRVLIMGAAGRDFHNFLCGYRDDLQSEVVALFMRRPTWNACTTLHIDEEVRTCVTE
jgi:hypothetical protein